MSDVQDEIRRLVKDNEIVLFMKGTRGAPRCGFSATVAEILDDLVEGYVDVDVLARPEIREGVKVFSNWPTIPQLYVRGEFIGGADIVRQMFEAKELHRLLGVAERPVDPPKLELTEAAAGELRRAMAGAEPGQGIRLSVGPRYQYDLSLDRAGPEDFVVEAGGLSIIVARSSARRADRTRIDFEARGSGGGFRLSNPNEPPRLGALSVSALKAKLDGGEPIHVIDVRTDEERAIAPFPGARAFDAETERWLASLDKGSALAFLCHHGNRSRGAGQHFVERGFRNVYNVEGGIDAWSREVDPSVPRY